MLMKASIGVLLDLAHSAQAKARVDGHSVVTSLVCVIALLMYHYNQSTVAVLKPTSAAMRQDLLSRNTQQCTV